SCADRRRAGVVASGGYTNTAGAWLRGWPARSLRFLRHVPGRERCTFAEEEVLHVLGHQLLRLFLPGHQAVLVEDHLHSIFPELPRIDRHVLVDALAELARPRRFGQPRQLLAKLHAEHHPLAGVWSISHVWMLLRSTAYGLWSRLVDVELSCNPEPQPRMGLAETRHDLFGRVPARKDESRITRAFGKRHELLIEFRRDFDRADAGHGLGFGKTVEP